MPTLVVLGTGSLARSICGSLAVLPGRGTPLRVVLVGRDAARVAEAGHLTTARARLVGSPLRVETRVVDFGLDDPAAEECSTDELAALFGALRPDGVLVCASSQSPWEARTAASAWTALLAAGFGVTLPLQALLAYRAARARAAAAPGAWLVNACYPDAVNPLLAALGAEVLCGIGNVAILAASLRAVLPDVDRRALRVLGHHAHLHRPADAADEALAWLDDEPVVGLTDALSALRATTRAELNQITGLAAARVLAALLTGAELRADLPGPLGLPGGYPVLLRDGGLALDLPSGLSAADALARNQRWAWLDGVRVADGAARFAPPVRAALAEGLPDLADGFAAHDLAAAAAHLGVLRDRLRERPATRPPSTSHRESA